MWMFLVIVVLLDQNQAAPTAGERGSSLQLTLQHLDQTTPPAIQDVTQQKTSSSSSSSSSSVSSESSQSSEGPQQVRERQNLENTAVEQMDPSQESSEVLQSPSNSSTSLWLSELVLLGERVVERDRERDTGDDSAESRRRAPLLTFHPLVSRPQARETEVGGATTHRGGVITSVGGTASVEGVVRGAEIDTEFPQLLDDSTEREDGLTFDLPDHAHHHSYHGDEAGLELGL